ncbi:hypothetical protein C7S18_12230 [Ahniella affigens]|uniref:Uncharacterized protein n=1 Tax=Ahniella affigens TaxID=2021234 RepID=A0A2P1PSU6_9GAMM|nr:hypothetical protein [Ahniella affigens]AVP97919.1 hypothetical protein C7S18_12230 [Ahniella affigens]
MRLSGRVDATLGAATHNWAPAGLEHADIIFVTCTAPVTLTGIVAQGRERVLVLCVVSGTLTLAAENGSSTDANRFGLAKDLDIETGARLVYDSIARRWRVT